MADISCRAPKRTAGFWLLLAISLAAATAAQVAPQGVFAHANLDHAEPAAGSKLTRLPDRISLYFTQSLVKETSWVQIRDREGKDMELVAEFDPAHPKLMRAVLPPLDPGVYTVRWQSQSADDDDYAQGSFELTLLNPDGSLPPGAQSAAKDSGGAISVYLLFVIVAGLAAAGGALWFRRRAS